MTNRRWGCGTFVWGTTTPMPGGMLVGFPALWVLFEWVRGWILTGFPWLYLGYAHIETWISGWAPVLGVYWLSFICALTGCCLFLAWRSRQFATGFGKFATSFGHGLGSNCTGQTFSHFVCAHFTDELPGLTDGL